MTDDAAAPRAIAGSRRIVVGSITWIAVVVLNYGLQVVAAAAWPVPYVIADHTVSDLGYTTCGSEERPGGRLETCSPLHPLFNIGGVVQYLALGAGALALRGRFGLGRPALAFLVVMVLGGVGVSVVPGDVNITAHALLALPLFLGALGAVICSAITGRRTDAALSLIAAVVAVATLAGLVWLGFALAGHGPVGWAERLAAESVYVWILACGIAGLLRPATGNRPSTGRFGAHRPVSG